MTTTSAAAEPEEKSAQDMIAEMEDYSRRFRAMRTKNAARMISMSDMVSYSETLNQTLKSMMATLFAYMDIGLQSLQDSGIGTEAVRPFITLTEQVVLAQSGLVVMVCQQAGFLNENGVTEKMPKETLLALTECDSKVKDWMVKRDSVLEKLSRLEAERAAEAEAEDAAEDADDEEGEDDEEEGAEDEGGDPASGPSADSDTGGEST